MFGAEKAMREMEFNARRPFSFALKVAAITLGLFIVFRVLGILVTLSPLTAVLAALAVAAVLFVTAARWITWLPALLTFGVINSLIGLLTGHAPTNSRVDVSPLASAMLLAFYSVGSIATYYFDPERLSSVERLGLLVYLGCILLPAIIGPNDLSSVRAGLVWPVTVGLIALLVALGFHRSKKAKRQPL